MGCNALQCQHYELEDDAIKLCTDAKITRLIADFGKEESLILPVVCMLSQAGESYRYV